MIDQNLQSFILNCILCPHKYKILGITDSLTIILLALATVVKYVW